ncbi:Histone H2A.Z-specific chaperone [Yamadazyma tenuis]|uniref:Histone H2A.Z-specific chaperone n=1 Tax=Candida tenuis TaxID=2315449 RepID=UPI0027A2CC0A|nr:Histone H2A.Z-specific chaperone [Yamadazyma tenuis]
MSEEETKKATEEVGTIEKVEIKDDAVEKKRPIDEVDGKEPQKTNKDKKKRRRRQYEDTVGKEKSDDEKDDDDEEEDDGGENFDDGEDDDLSEIDTTNIITSGRRTRGKVIDFQKASEKLAQEGLREDDEEDDNEFEAK